MTTTTLQPQTADAPLAASATSRASAWLAVAAAILAVVLAPPIRGDPLPPGVFGTVTEGHLEQLVGGIWRLASPGDLVAEGARVRTRDDDAVMRTRGGALSLAAGSVGRLESGQIELEAGDVLVEEEGPVDVTSGAVRARGRGTWRVDLTGSPRVGVYEGGATVLDASDRRVSVAGLQQADLVEGALGRGMALRYLESDPWDARILAGPIAVDRQVAQLMTSLRNEYGTSLQSAAFYADFVEVEGQVAEALPALSRFRDGDRFGPPSETLVAVVVAALLNDRAGLSDQEAVAEIRSLRRSGATWGLVLGAHDLGPDDFREAADAALRLRQLEEASGTAAPVVTGPVETEGTGQEPEPPTGGGETEPPDGGSEEPEPEPSPTPTEDDPVDQLTDPPVEDVVDDVGDLLEPVPGGSEAANDVGELLEDPPALP